MKYKILILLLISIVVMVVVTGCVLCCNNPSGATGICVKTVAFLLAFPLVARFFFPNAEEDNDKHRPAVRLLRIRLAT